jgi:class 3 adenylate cyclase
MEIKINERLLEEKLKELQKGKPWHENAIAKLEELIRSSDDYSLFRVNPLKFGEENAVSEQESIDLFLYATKAGLFEMNWQLVCPGCGDVVESFNTLRNLDSRYHCGLCQRDFEAALDDYIEVSFTIDPRIREIAFHSPQSLSIEDYFFKYVFSHGAVYPDGTRSVDVIQRLLKILTYLEPGEKKDFEVEIPAGYLVGYDRMNHAEFLFKVSGELKPGIQHFSSGFLDGEYFPAKYELSPGRYVFRLENHTNKRGAILLIHEPTDYSAPGQLRYRPFLTGKKVLTTQTFRDCFRSEVIQGTEGIGVKDITILFTDLKESTVLYDDIGDLKAFAVVRQHFDSLGKVVNIHSGAIVKTIGDAIMAAFLNPLDAVEAALGMINEMERFNLGFSGKDVKLKIGIHKGSSVAVTLNDRLDYFGQTVNISSRVQKLADGDEIYVSDDVYNFPGVREILKDFEVVLGKANLKGVQGEIQVYRIKKSAVIP